MPARLNLRAALDSTTGYGRSGIGLARALQHSGYEVSLSPIHVGTPLPRDVAEMLTVAPSVPTDLILSMAPPQDLGLSAADSHSYLRVAWTMYEFDSFGDFSDEARARVQGFHLILAYDETTKAAYEALGDVPPVKVYQGGYEASPWVSDEPFARDWTAETFVFCMAGNLSARKNPMAAVRTVQRLKDEGLNVEMWLKTRTENDLPPGLEEAHSSLKIFTGVWSDEQMKNLYLNAHCYIGPSWGEGLNLPAMEAGTTGTALILSDCGGHRGWAHPAFATLVGGTKNTYTKQPFLEVDEEQLYQACKELVKDREKARVMGFQASTIIPQTMDWETIVRRLLTEVLR